MRIVIAGPGRAGASVGLAAVRAGHEIVGVLSRTSTGLDLGPDLDWDARLPEADLLIIAVRDDAIEEVARKLAPNATSIDVAAHLSGFTAISALGPIAAAGASTGGFHPLQTLPDPIRGAEALAGAHVGIGGDDRAVTLLNQLGRSLGMSPFPLTDEARPTYHAAAAAAANFVITSLATSANLFEAAGVDPTVSRPLVLRTVDNLFDSWPEVPLTGPIARGDIETVRGHIGAAAAISSGLEEQFRLMARATAIRAGRSQESEQWS
jgi:predicted short-subunit dehydrogenase-like oxidoreductase (DUF2520 family)